MRIKHWKSNFRRKLREVVDQPFVWGETDCCQFCATMIEAVTGENPMAHFPAYATELEAQRMIVRAGGLDKLATKWTGVEPILPDEHGKDIVPGDLLMCVDQNRRQYMGVAMSQMGVFKTKDRVIPVPFGACTLQWRIR